MSRRSSLRGATFSEALILVAMIGIASAAAMRTLGSGVEDKILCQASALASPGAGSSSSCSGGEPPASIGKAVAIKATPNTSTPVVAPVGTATNAPEFPPVEPIPIGAHSKDKKKSPSLTQISKPNPDLPDPFSHPPATRWDGKCGVTACSNMLRFYGVEKDPKHLDMDGESDSTPGMRAGTVARNISKVSGKKFEAKSISGDALVTLRGYLDEGKPVAVLYMTGVLEAHWVVVTNVENGKDGTVLTVQSWGGWYTVKWTDFEYQWKRGWGGPYPHVVGDEASPVLRKAMVAQFYREILGREGKPEEIAVHANSNLPLSKLRRNIADSPEATARSR